MRRKPSVGDASNSNHSPAQRQGNHKIIVNRAVASGQLRGHRNPAHHLEPLRLGERLKVGCLFDLLLELGAELPALALELRDLGLEDLFDLGGEAGDLLLEGVEGGWRRPRVAGFAVAVGGGLSFAVEVVLGGAAELCVLRTRCLVRDVLRNELLLLCLA